MNRDIQNVPDALRDRRRPRAAENRRALTGAALRYLEVMVARERPVHVYGALSRIRALRRTLNVPLLTDELLDEAINEGRP